ncbi:hypothetical protein ACFY15_16555 [Streptomyces sp. NPDC001373]|uniref:hypothetical protein n=1 Tax=Streptomyces sp. NPDC001373 TaxID=3364565 RepID=UPI0036C6897F
MVFTVASTSGVVLRPYTSADVRQVLALVDADRLPGQPVTTPAMLAEALAGRAAVRGR